jgi:osmotically-inducible protein OsmY
MKWLSFGRLLALSALLAGLATAGCLTVAGLALEDRTTDDQATDTKISAGILSRLSDKDKGLLLDVNVDVWEQRVMLTGTLDDPAMKKAVVELVGADARIKKIYDELQIVTKEEKERRRQEAKKQNQDSKEGAGQSVNDFWIGTKIDAQLVGAGGVKSVDYRWRSVRNKVYIIGRARDEAERSKVLDICRNTKGVESVKHFIEIKPVATK